ncbi:MAG: hypothetical protein HYV04_09150 [Deltaproteobacteria bacterium]|nr:hypothetical protein [Deltaproteobacteria bacterium]
MNHEVELRRLPMRDKSVVVLTDQRVYHLKDNGIFGEEQTTIRHKAITSIQIGWKRSEGLLWSGIILLGISLLVWLGSVMMGPAGTAADQQALELWSEEGFTLEQVLRYVGGFFSSSFASTVKYASLLAGIGTLLLFWFYKLIDVQIVGPGATIKGSPKSYEEGSQFCDRLLAVVEGKPATIQKEAPLKTTDKQEKGPEKEWRL